MAEKIILIALKKTNIKSKFSDPILNFKKIEQSINRFYWFYSGKKKSKCAGKKN